MNWARILGCVTCAIGVIGLCAIPGNSGAIFFTYLMIITVFLWHSEENFDRRKS